MSSQQKIAWKKFQHAFPSDGHCLEKIIQGLRLAGKQFCCSRCGSSLLKRRFGQRRYFCEDCHYRGWILAGTFFEFIRKARLWLGVIWLFENGESINAWQYHNLAGCAYSTALMIFRKMGSVLHQSMETLDSVKNTMSGSFISLFWKRSNQTPIGEHPVMEQDYFDQLDTLVAEEVNDLPENQGELSHEENSILQLLSENKLHFDDICRGLPFVPGIIIGSMTVLELKDLVDRHPGDYFSLKSKKQSKRILSATDSNSIASKQKIDAFCDFIKSRIHGISRKYLQFYLAIFWCIEDRKRWCSEKLLEACCRSDFKSSRTLFQYVTPSEVLIT